MTTLFIRFRRWLFGRCPECDIPRNAATCGSQLTIGTDFGPVRLYCTRKAGHTGDHIACGKGRNSKHHHLRIWDGNDYPDTPTTSKKQEQVTT